MQYIIAQIIGGIGLICSLLSFQCKNRKKIMTFQMLGSLSFCVQLFVLGAITGGYLDLICFVRTIIFSKKGEKKWADSIIWLIAFSVILVVIGIITWENAYSILPIIGSVLSTIALWMKSAKNIRKISLLVGPCWFIYNIINGAITGAINELLAMTSIIIGMIRHDVKKKE